MHALALKCPSCSLRIATRAVARDDEFAALRARLRAHLVEVHEVDPEAAELAARAVAWQPIEATEAARLLDDAPER